MSEMIPAEYEGWWRITETSEWTSAGGSVLARGEGRARDPVVDRRLLLEPPVEAPRAGRHPRSPRTLVAEQHGVKVRWEVPTNRVRAAERVVERAKAGSTIRVIGKAK